MKKLLQKLFDSCKPNSSLPDTYTFPSPDYSWWKKSSAQDLKERLEEGDREIEGYSKIKDN